MVWLIVVTVLVVLSVLFYPALASYQRLFCSRRYVEQKPVESEAKSERERALVALRGGDSLQEGVCLRESHFVSRDLPLRYAIPCCVCGGPVDKKNLQLVRRIDQSNVHEACVAAFLYRFLFERYRLARRLFVDELGEVFRLVFHLLYHRCLFSPRVEINTDTPCTTTVINEK